ncbi:MAG: hypothetical protein ACJ77A_04875 [Actinomycetota bacterium]
MGEPFVYVGTWTIKEGKFEEARKALAEHCRELVEPNEPRLIAFHVYFDEEGRTASVVQVHPDSDSMEFHMELISKHLSGAFEVIDRIVSEQYYGPMSASLSETLAKWEGPGVTVTKMPIHEAGFTRTNALR